MSFTLCLAYGERNELLDLAYRYTPRIEPLGDGSAFLSLPSGGLARFFASLAGAFPEGEVQGGAGSSPLIARAALLAGRDGWRRGLKVCRYARGAAYCVPPGGERTFISALPVARLWPVPEDVRRALSASGFLTLGEVARAGEQVLVARFGPLGRLIAAYARGEDGRRVAALYPPAILSWRRELPGVSSSAPLLPALEEGARDLARELRERGMGCRRLELTLTVDHGPSLSLARVTAGLPPDAVRLYTQLSLLLARLEPREAVAAVRVVAAELYPLVPQQVDLFAFRQAAGQENLARAVAAVEEKHPGSLVRARSLLTGLRRERALACYDPWRADRSSAAGQELAGGRCREAGRGMAV
ncbi:MAG: hypothetical protein QMC81_10135 [Thermoanaerobacterales bacterium]|nr:hypothetical protein [Thermoanaerobacterales bacterium]